MDCERLRRAQASRESRTNGFQSVSWERPIADDSSHTLAMRDRKSATVDESAVQSVSQTHRQRVRTRILGNSHSLPSMIVLSKATAGEGRRKTEAPLTRY